MVADHLSVGLQEQRIALHKGDPVLSLTLGMNTRFWLTRGIPWQIKTAEMAMHNESRWTAELTAIRLRQHLQTGLEAETRLLHGARIEDHLWHRSDLDHQTAGPCGLVIEIGPVPQMVLDASTVEQTRLCLQACLEVLAEANRGELRCPPALVVHRHLGSLDLPRDATGQPEACIHPERQGKDWIPLVEGDPLFLKPDGQVIRYHGPDGQVPVFINEAAYGEKGIALSLTVRETWPLTPQASEALSAVLALGDQRGTPL